MKRLLLSFTVLASLFAAALVTSCTEDATETVSFSSFSVTPTEIGKLYVGESKQLEVTTDPSATIEEYVQFSVSPISPDKTCAVVDETGVVTGVSVGDAIIAVSSKDGTWMELVTVSVFDVVYPVSSIEINGDYDTNASGERVMYVYTSNASAAAGLFTATITPEEASTTDVVWTLDDPEKTGSLISTSGDFTPGSEVGTVTIWATLFDSYAFYDDEYTDEDLADEEIVAKYTYTDYLTVIFTTGVLTFAEESVNLSIGDEPYTILYDLVVESTSPVVSWTSSNQSVVTVDEDGVITVVGAGTATVTASCEGVFDTMTVNVAYLTLTDITIDQGATATVDAGASTTFTATPNTNANPSVAWSIVGTDATASSINASTGVFTAGSYKGTVTVRATSTEDSTIYDDITITVNVPVISISMPSTLTVAAGDVDMNALVVFNPSSPSNTELTWTSSASITSAGVVTVAGADGTTITVTATSKDNASATATCTITISSSAASVTSITLNTTAAELTLGTDASTTLTADSSVLWSSSDSNVATVDASTGVVTGVAEGTATITATSTTNPSVSATCTITVKPTYVTSFTVADVSVVVGKSATVLPVIAPTYATYQGYTVEVTSGAENIIFDAETGTVIGNAVGTATILFTPEDTTASAVTCTVTITSGAGIGNLEEGDGSFLIQ